ncbi:hypothetical protein [uncultured Serinicoccus sp.]|uniref:hypothetical protein n=1 Tax=uncultured Serinicoccus sp. TaxID=735514 RepID=UPI002628624B|nr:hypothetical protein [uncultured Serinicoccus sp.]
MSDPDGGPEPGTTPSGPGTTPTGPGTTPTGTGPRGGPVLVVTAVELELLEDAHDRLLDATALDEGAARHGRVTGSAPGADPPATPERARPARAEALLSLQGRGLLDADGALTTGTAFTDLVLVMLDVRLAAEALLVVERRFAGAEERPDLRLLHLIAAGGVAEDLHGGGWHGFDLLVDPGQLAEEALAPVLPPDARPGRGEPVVLDPEDPDAAADALGAGLLAELTLARPGSGTEESVLLAVGASGCHVAWAPGTPREGPPTARAPDDHPAARPTLTFAPTSPDALRAVVLEWVSRVVDPVPSPRHAPT